MKDKKVLIIKQKSDEELWVKLRNLAWNYDKKIFSKLDEHTFDIIKEENNKIEYEEEDVR